MGSKIDLTGQRFGLWTVLVDTNERDASGAIKWLCECECGTRRKVASVSLMSGVSQSCGGRCRVQKTNTYVIRNDDSTIINCNNSQSFVIDTSDLPLVSQYQWWIDTKGYVKSKVQNRQLLLSRLLFDVHEKGRSVFVDHISGDTLDNRRTNLRVCLPSDNIKNRKLNKNNATGYKGVSLHRKLEKYRADIRAGGGKTIYLGVYDSPIEAATAYDRAASLYHGQYARTNAQIQIGEA